MSQQRRARSLASAGRLALHPLLAAASVCLLASSFVPVALGWCHGIDGFCDNNVAGRYTCGENYACRLRPGGGLASDGGGWECTCQLKAGIIAAIVLSCVAFSCSVGVTFIFLIRRCHLKNLDTRARAAAATALAQQANQPTQQQPQNVIAMVQPAPVQQQQQGGAWAQPVLAYGQPVAQPLGVYVHPQAQPAYPTVYHNNNEPPPPAYNPGHAPFSGGYISAAARAEACQRCGYAGGEVGSLFCTSCGAAKQAPPAVSVVQTRPGW